MKGNKNSNIYHVPTGAHYDQKMNNVQWFCTEEEAEKAGYRQSKN
ncbi:sunset domain-containing protein [Priestia flexa]